jgi:UDP:flavonoid glycosyltransferase YjiC (YdhE family)
MKRIVFCWELGGNYGHITSFLPFYRELVKAGMVVDFIVRDLGFAHKLLGEQGIRYFQAPLPRDESNEAIFTYSYTDLLAQIGYLDANRLTGYVSAWRDLFVLLNADMVIADHSPTALLAARSLGLPTAIFGSGFLNPPVTNPFPIFHVWSGVPDEVARKHEAGVLHNINLVLQGFGQKPLVFVSEILDVDENFLCTIPELDHYEVREGQDYWGPYFIDDIGIEPDWPGASGPKIFAYVTTKVKSLELFLQDLQVVQGSKLVHIPRASQELKTRFERADLRITAEPVRMKSVLAVADLVVHQAGIGTVSACAMAGVKQLLLPTQLEQRMLTKRLVGLKLAYGIDPEQPNPAYKNALVQVLASQQLAENVRNLHHKYLGFNQQEQYSVMAEVVADLLDA